MNGDIMKIRILEVKQRHLSERKHLLVQALDDRKFLLVRYKSEIEDFKSNSKQTKKLSDLFREQTSELMELKVTTKDKWYKLVGRQQEEQDETNELYLPNKNQV